LPIGCRDDLLGGGEEDPSDGGRQHGEVQGDGINPLCLVVTIEVVVVGSPAMRLESSLSPGADQECAPPWLGFQTICNSYSDVDDEDESFSNFDGLFCAIRRWERHDESSDEDHSASDDEKSASDVDDDRTGEVDDRATVARIMLGLSTHQPHQVSGRHKRLQQQRLLLK